MNTELSGEAIDFERAVASALAASGGFEHVRRAESDPSHRYAVGEQLAQLGMWELNTRDDSQMEAAALGCRAAGRVALPYPIAERIVAYHVKGADAVGLVTSATSPVAHADLDLQWSVIGMDGRTAPVAAARQPGRTKLAGFTARVVLGPWDKTSDIGPVLLTLQSWTLLGMLQAALDLTCEYVRDRRQFGQALAEFQSVQFALTDVSVATQGLEELCKYTLWAVLHRPAQAWTDALVLRTASLEAAETTFRVGHQLHGAIGFCDESNISWLSRYSQVLRRLPLGRAQTEAALAAQIARTTFYTPVVMEAGQ